MADVYRAYATHMHRDVALKVITPALADDPAFRERFLQESRHAASLEHPRVLPVHDSGEEDGVLYLALRYIRPRRYNRADLGAVLDQEGPLPPDTAVHLLSQAAEALDAAHEHDLVHRDVTPGNLLVDAGDKDLREACVYLTDFGITKRAAAASPRTQTGFIGTPPYAAPEQILNGVLDRRTDVYGLAAVAYRALTGHLPFDDAPDVEALKRATCEEPPLAPSVHRPILPPAVDEVFARALAKRREDRPASAGAFVRELQAASTHDRPTSPRRRRLITAVLAALAALAAVVFMVLPRVDGTDLVGHTVSQATVPISLQHPAGWTQRDRPGESVVFSPQDAQALFAGDGDAWGPVVQRLRTDPTAVTGLYLGWDDAPAALTNGRALRDQVDAHLPITRVSWNDGSRGITVDGRSARVMTGVARPPTSTDRIDVQAVVVQHGEPADASAVLVFFGPEAVLDTVQQQVLDSVRFLS
jgi:serine/threonine-protein kinase